jgi:hypothetical protein
MRLIKTKVHYYHTPKHIDKYKSGKKHTTALVLLIIIGETTKS